MSYLATLKFWTIYWVNTTSLTYSYPALEIFFGGRLKRFFVVQAIAKNHLISILNEIERLLNSGFSQFAFKVIKDLVVPKLTAFKNLFKKTKSNY
jgi:hypothetical protein